MTPAPAGLTLHRDYRSLAIRTAEASHRYQKLNPTSWPNDYLIPISFYYFNLSMIMRHRGHNSSTARPVILTVAAQAIAVASGWICGFAALNHASCVPNIYISWPLWVNLPAAIASLTLFAEGIRCLVSNTSGRGRLTAALFCLALGIYTAWLMHIEPFLYYGGNIGFVIYVHLLIPILIGISFLTRGRAWAGVAASMVFIATSLGMIIHNACCKGGLNGFFESIVF